MGRSKDDVGCVGCLGKDCELCDYRQRMESLIELTRLQLKHAMGNIHKLHPDAICRTCRFLWVCHIPKDSKVSSCDIYRPTNNTLEKKEDEDGI